MRRKRTVRTMPMVPVIQTTEQAEAHQYRLLQARELLIEAGFVEQPDGSFRQPG
jgi:hypothetical protein